MAEENAEPSPAPTLPSPNYSLEPNLLDRLPVELKLAICKNCIALGGKPLLVRLMGTSKELQELGRPLIYRDLSFTLPESFEPANEESLQLACQDRTFSLFALLSRGFGHLVKSVRLQRAPHGVWNFQHAISIVRSRGFKRSLCHLSSLQELDISEYTSLAGPRVDIEGDDYLLTAAPTFSNTLTSLRLSSNVEHFSMHPDRLAQLLGALPLLTALSLQDVGTNQHESRPEDYTLLKEATGSLHHLSSFRISEVDDSFLANLRLSGPLEILDDRASHTYLPDLIEVIRSHEATLHSIFVRGVISGRKEAIPTDADNLRFPHLVNLSLDGHLDLSFVARFNSSPLHFLKIVQINSDPAEDEYSLDPVAEARSVKEVLRLVEVHRDTLKLLDVKTMSLRDTRLLLGRLEEEWAAGEDTPGTRALEPWRVVRERCSELGIITKWY